MAADLILLAAGFDWLEALLPLLFVFIWIVSQVASVFRRVAAAGRRDEDDDEEEDDQDLSELLGGQQRSGARRCPGCGHQFVAAAAAIAPCPECGRLTLDESPADPDLVDDLPVQSDREVIEAEIDAFLNRSRRQPPPLPQPARPATPQADSLAEPVAAMLAAAGSTERANDEISRHIHDVFDKGLSRLPEGVVESPWADLEQTRSPQRSVHTDAFSSDAAAVASLTGSLAATLKNPATVKQAFLLREVLDRPTDRWA